MCRIKYSTKRNQIEIQKSRFENFQSCYIYDVIHDALEEICKKNRKRPRNFGDIGSFCNIGTDMILAKDPAIA
jgi:hypothetical protein